MSDPVGETSVIQTCAIQASLHEVLLFQPDLPISFAIERVVTVQVEPAINDSKAASRTEMRVKIRSDRATYIKA